MFKQTRQDEPRSNPSSLRFQNLFNPPPFVTNCFYFLQKMLDSILKEVIWAFCVCCERPKCTLHLWLFIFRSISEQQSPQCTANTLLPWIYPALFTLQIASHWVTRLAIWHCVQGETGGERERGRRAIWIGVWSIFKPFSSALTWSDQKHPTGTGPCSHKGRPLMPLPLAPLLASGLSLTRCYNIKVEHS